MPIHQYGHDTGRHQRWLAAAGTAGRRRAATKAMSSVANSTREKSAGTGKIYRQAMRPPAAVATAKAAMIGRASDASLRATSPRSHSTTDWRNTLTESE